MKTYVDKNRLYGYNQNEYIYLNTFIHSFVHHCIDVRPIVDCPELHELIGYAWHLFESDILPALRKNRRGCNNG